MSSLLNKMLMNTFYRVWSSCYVKAEFVSKNASNNLRICSLVFQEDRGSYCKKCQILSTLNLPLIFESYFEFRSRTELICSCLCSRAQASPIPLPVRPGSGDASWAVGRLRQIILGDRGIMAAVSVFFDSEEISAAKCKNSNYQNSYIVSN